MSKSQVITCTARYRLCHMREVAHDILPEGCLTAQAKVLLTCCLCFADGLCSAYSDPVPFQRDGLYLLHKEGHYSLTSTPLAVLWKDSLCSRYFIDTDAKGVVPEHQVGP